MLRADAGERHALFEDELFSRSQEWKLSTSGLSAGYQFRGTGCVCLTERGTMSLMLSVGIQVRCSI